MMQEVHDVGRALTGFEEPIMAEKTTEGSIKRRNK
jgi:hypothetical protein